MQTGRRQETDAEVSSRLVSSAGSCSSPGFDTGPRASVPVTKLAQDGLTNSRLTDLSQKSREVRSITSPPTPRSFWLIFANQLIPGCLSPEVRRGERWPTMIGPTGITQEPSRAAPPTSDTRRASQRDAWPSGRAHQLGRALANGPPGGLLHASEVTAPTRRKVTPATLFSASCRR